jgi:hypothetical protein
VDAHPAELEQHALEPEDLAQHHRAALGPGLREDLVLERLDLVIEVVDHRQVAIDGDVEDRVRDPRRALRE